LRLSAPHHLNPFRSLPARISLFVLGATLLTSLIVTGVSVRSIDTFLRGKLELKFPEIAEEAGRLVTVWYDQQLLNLGVLAASDVLKGNLGSMKSGTSEQVGFRASHDVAEYLQYVLDLFPHFDSLFILRPDGESLIWVGNEYALSRETIDELLRSPKQPKPRLTEVGEQFLQIVSARIADQDGKMIGLLSAVMPLEAVAEPLRTQRLGETGEIYLVNEAQISIAAGRTQIRTSVLERPLAAAVILERVVDYTNDAGVRVVGYAIEISEHGLTLVVEERYDQAFASLLSTFRRVLSINLAVVLLFGVAAYQVAVSIARPIEALSEAARRISEDEENVELPETRAQDEVGVLTRTFSQMTARLADKAEALEQSQAETERAVQQMRDQNAELQRVNEVLEQLSITDGLTGLHNHRYFQEQLVKEIKRADRVGDGLSLILIDIDHFKKWNDQLGHAGGDEILRQIAQMMNTVVRETDVLARYGGEEFALILPTTELEGATQLAEKIRSTVAESSIALELPQESMSLTVSVGVNVYRGDASALFDGADQALYRAKDGGRDCVIVAEDPD
jgi:diguanylate cyclase (GGDEF)-like protein